MKFLNNDVKNKNNGVMSKNNGVKGVFSFSKPNSYQIVTTSIEMVINLKNYSLTKLKTFK